MLKKTTLAGIVAAVCVQPGTGFAEPSAQLEKITVEEQADNAVTSTTVTRAQLEQLQPVNIKSVFSRQLDVSVNDLQGTRSGNDGINIRGLQGNRVGMSIDGVPVPDAQENKIFVTYGMDYGRGDFVDPSALKEAKVYYGGSAQGLSGHVNFTTLDAEDLLKSRAFGGFAATGYNSVDSSTYGTLGGAARFRRGNTAGWRLSI